MKRLGDGDQGIKMNALTLLNVTIGSTDNQKEIAQLIKYWSDADIVEILRVMVIF